IRASENGNDAQGAIDTQLRSSLDLADRDIEHDAVFAVLAQIAPRIDAADSLARGGDLSGSRKAEHGGHDKGENSGFRFHGILLLLQDRTVLVSLHPPEQGGMARISAVYRRCCNRCMWRIQNVRKQA